jgi:hypothetical protein
MGALVMAGAPSTRRQSGRRDHDAMPECWQVNFHIAMT